jgi:hypothetical protein
MSVLGSPNENILCHNLTPYHRVPSVGVQTVSLSPVSTKFVHVLMVVGMRLKAPPSASSVNQVHVQIHISLSGHVAVADTLLSILVMPPWLSCRYLDLAVILACTSFSTTPTPYFPFAALSFSESDLLLEHHQMLLQGISCVPYCNIARSA